MRQITRSVVTQVFHFTPTTATWRRRFGRSSAWPLDSDSGKKISFKTKKGARLNKYMYTVPVWYIFYFRSTTLLSTKTSIYFLIVHCIYCRPVFTYCNLDSVVQGHTGTGSYFFPLLIPVSGTGYRYRYLIP